MRSKKKITIKEVANHAGVSVTTVSNYLNKRYANMSQHTRDVIEQSINDLGYYPSIGARTLPSRRKTKTVGIIIPQNINFTFHHPYFAEVMGGLSSTLEENHYRAMILIGGDRSKEDLNYLKILSNGIVDGFIFFDVNNQDIYVRNLSSMEIPIMVVGKNPIFDSNYVDTDIVEGVKQGVSYLIRQRRGPVLMISGPENMMFSQQSLEGYRQALEGNDVPYNELMVKYGPFSMEFGYEIGCKVFSGELKTTAIYSSSGQTTLGIMKAAESLGVDVFSSYSIVSFGEHPVLTSMFPWMPYIKQDEKSIGQMLGTRLIEMLHNGTSICDSVVFPATTVNMD